MWRIVDKTGGRIAAALKERWSCEAVNEAIQGSHSFGVATNIAQELTDLGFMRQKDFDIRSVKAFLHRPGEHNEPHGSEAGNPLSFSFGFLAGAAEYAG